MESLNCLSKESIELLYKNKLLLPLIKAEVLKFELSKIKIDKAENNKALEIFKEKLGLKDPQRFQDWVKLNNYESKELEHIYLSELLINKYHKKYLSHKKESHFLKRKKDLDIVIYSLIRLPGGSNSLANELYLKIVEKEKDFGELSSLYSTGIERKTRGIIGPVPLVSAHPKLAEHIVKNPPGEVLQPIEVNGSYLIVRVESYDPAKLDDFMSDKMGEELFAEMIEVQATDMMNSLIQNIELKTN